MGASHLRPAHRLVSELRHELAQGRDPGAAHLENRERLRGVTEDAAANTFAGAARRVDRRIHRTQEGSEATPLARNPCRFLGLDYPASGGEPTKVRGGIVDRWAERPITEIDGHDIHGVIDESRRIGIPGLSARNEGVSDSRGRKMADALGSLFKWLMRSRTISVNPCVGAYRPHAPEARDRVLTNVEITKFWLASGTLSQPFGPVLKLLLLTGCRLNEVAGMKYDEKSPEQWTIPGGQTKKRQAACRSPHIPCEGHYLSVPKIEKSPLFLRRRATRPSAAGQNKDPP